MSPTVLLAVCLALPPPDSCTPPLAETYTNHLLSVQTERLGSVQFTLALDAAPSNNVEIAVGTDVNSDGDLSLEEADFTFGYDCGAWFLAETETGDVTTSPAPIQGRIEQTLVLRKRECNPQWNRIKLVRRGTGATAETANVTIDYPGTLLILR